MITNETVPDQTLIATKPQLATVSPVPLASPTQPIPTKKSPWLVVVLVLALVEVAGYFGLQNYQLSQQADIQQPTPTPSTQLVESSPLPLVDPTADWQTYLDNEYKLSFKYPAEWKLNCTTPPNDDWLDRNLCDITSPNTSIDHGDINGGGYFVVGISKPNPNYSNLIEYIDYSTKQQGYTSQLASINNIRGYYLTRNNVKTNYVFEQNGMIIVANWIASNEEFTNLVNHILSSFQLTN